MASPFDAVGNASTLGGVVLGAVVATLGSFAASWYERRMSRRERETEAALVFGELLRALAIQLTLLRQIHSRGDPYGPITIRMARAVRREVEIYDRNRERLFHVRDGSVRAAATGSMSRLTFALDRMLDNTDALALAGGEAERGELIAGREQAWGFLMQCANELPALADRFVGLAANAGFATFDLETVSFRPPAPES